MSEFLRYGIDLGTTNSCVASSEGGDVRIYQNNDQMNVTPSVVRLLKTGRIVTGKRAYNAIADDPDNVALEFKRWMGQKSVKEFPAAGRSMTAEALSAEVLKALRDDVARAVGEDLRASVVAVPAAFGALQCDATARACDLAGLEQAPLLQEPIAAAIAYGVTPGARDQRWMVFDLGGGTLDIAVVSTRDGRLNVLEHRGNNLLGGKDVDRAIVEHYFLPALLENFELHDPVSDAAGHRRLWRRLLVNAEEAKIDLSSLDSVMVSLIDLGDDARGRPIELELTLTRSQLEREIEPVVERALSLAEEALDGARILGSDLDRVLLVGGPTQIPYVRAAIASRLGAKVEFSIDPMTAVARGAALYAATVERESKFSTPNSAAASVAQNGSVKGKLTLAFEPVSAQLSTIVAGKVESTKDVIAEMKIDAESGYWVSGWIRLIDGVFELPVMLQEGKATRFFVYARDATGSLVDVEPDELLIRHGLVVGAPPLPHTIAVEVSRPNGKSELDPIFRRGTPLPAERTVRYRSSKACKPGETETSLVIKLWEGEDLTEANANDWVGNVKIDAAQIRRPIPEGSEIEVTIKIDASRVFTIEAFVPHLSQHFSDRLYAARDEERDFGELAADIPEQISLYRSRLEEVESTTDPGASTRDSDVIRRLRKDIDDLDAQAESTPPGRSEDPDQARRLVEASRSVRSRLGRLEMASGVDSTATVHLAQTDSARNDAKDVVMAFGTALEKRELQMLESQFERWVEKGDDRALMKIREAFTSLRWRVLLEQDWWWREVFESMQLADRTFLSRESAEKLFEEGALSIRAGDGARLREIVKQLWKLQPEDEAQKDQERALRSGLRRY